MSFKIGDEVICECGLKCNYTGVVTEIYEDRVRIKLTQKGLFNYPVGSFVDLMLEDLRLITPLEKVLR